MWSFVKVNFKSNVFWERMSQYDRTQLGVVLSEWHTQRPLLKYYSAQLTGAATIFPLFYALIWAVKNFNAMTYIYNENVFQKSVPTRKSLYESS